MKFFFAALFLASIAFTVQGNQEPTSLEARWKMDEPEFTYDAERNLFTLDFPTASALNVAGTGMDEIFYDFNCQDDGSPGFVGYEIPAANRFSVPALTTTGPDGKPRLVFRIDTETLANDDNIYTEYDGVRDRRELVVSDSSPTEPTPIFECTRKYLDDNLLTYGCNSANPPIQCMINGGCGRGIEAGYYPDLSKKNSYCHCTGTTAPSNYQQCNSVLLWKSFNTGTSSYLSGSVSGVPLGKFGLWGTNGGICDWDSNMSDKRIERPPWYTPSDVTYIGDTPSVDSWGDGSGGDNSSGSCSAGSGSGDRYGEMKMCVRTSLGYTSGTYQEVNFIESLITIRYDLTAGFCVDAFAVEPKERLETTTTKEYGLEAWLCAPDDTEALADPVRTLPKRITSCSRPTHW